MRASGEKCSRQREHQVQSLEVRVARFGVSQEEHRGHDNQHAVREVDGSHPVKLWG